MKYDYEDITPDKENHERMLKWDEENRLHTFDYKGFADNAYDADGEHTVKTSGEGEQEYVNLEFAG